MHIAKWTKNKEIQQILLSAPTPCKAEFILQDMHMSDVESIIRAESFNIFAIVRIVASLISLIWF